jgi:hypothetical protein
MIVRASLVLSLAAVLIGGEARAQPEPPLSGAALQEHFDRGVEAERAGRHADACALFEEVLRHHDEPLVRVNLAISYRAVGRYADAIAQLERYLAAPLSTEGPAQLRQMREAIAEMSRRLAHLTLRVRPEGATVRVDRRPLRGETIALDPGEHVVEASATGHHPQRRELRLEPGRDDVVELTLAPVETTGRVVVTPDPQGASVSVDGARRGAGALDLTLPAGDHLVEVTAPSRAPLRRSVTVTPGGVVHVDATLTSSRPGWVVPVIVAGSVVVVGAAVALVLALTRPDGQADVPWATSSPLVVW